MNELQRARELFCADRFSTLMGAQIERVGQHEAVCSLRLTDSHRNARGVAMGGVLFTLADFASAVAAHTDCLESGEVKWVSLNSSIHYLSPASGSSLMAEAKPIKLGRTTALFQVQISDADSGRSIVLMQTTMMNVGA